MPTLNSERTIRLALESISKQHFDQNLIEVLVIDGGSTDQTRSIALEYGCRIIENPLIQPECAKHAGILAAQGEYAIFLDSDEVFESKDAIRSRIEILRSRDDIKMVLTGGYTKPEGYSPINDYINTFSDPFSFFMYGISSGKGYYFESFTRRYSLESETDRFAIVTFQKSDPLPLVDACAGNAINLRYIKETYAESIGEVSIIPRLFSLIASDTGKVALLKNDSILHYSSDSCWKYVRKLRWRVVVNIYFVDKVGVGFSNREDFQPLLFRMKKYFFIPYALSLVLPLCEAVYYAVSRRKSVNLLHFPLTMYTAIFILQQLFLKALGYSPKLKSYGA